MDKKSVSIMIAVLCCILFLSACNNAPPLADTPTEQRIIEEDPFYTIYRNSDITYSYQIIDKNGFVLISENHTSREPHIEQVHSDVYGVTVQTGTGRSTNWAIYCDVQNSKISETYSYVMATKGDYVVFVDYRNGDHFVIVQDIFDKALYYQEYKLENVAPVAGDCVTDCVFDDNGTITVTYLAGEEYVETNFTISLP